MNIYQGKYKIEVHNGNKYWYYNNELHREDGPAIECVDGSKYWFLNGNEYDINSVEELIIASIIE